MKKGTQKTNEAGQTLTLDWLVYDKARLEKINPRRIAKMGQRNPIFKIDNKSKLRRLKVLRLDTVTLISITALSSLNGGRSAQPPTKCIINGGVRKFVV